jgi:hypothetical protein
MSFVSEKNDSFFFSTLSRTWVRSCESLLFHRRLPDPTWPEWRPDAAPRYGPLVPSTRLMAPLAASPPPPTDGTHRSALVVTVPFHRPSSAGYIPSATSIPQRPGLAPSTTFIPRWLPSIRFGDRFTRATYHENKSELLTASEATNR